MYKYLCDSFIMGDYRKEIKRILDQNHASLLKSEMHENNIIFIEVDRELVIKPDYVKRVYE